MSFELKSIAYGWKIGVAAVLTGATIYTANNVLMRIMQRDAVQVILGTHERCLATQTGTNADGSGIYAVAPPSFVRSWYSNSYESTVTNGVTNWTAVLHTNVFTNVISERLDHAMMVELDAKIFALVPYYLNTNVIFKGTTNDPQSLTVTGLFANLQIGDKTNKFTSIPCWTNNVGQTNCTTNAATYGPWAWRNYVVAWQERYKVLNALTTRIVTPSLSGTNHYGHAWWTDGTHTNWIETKNYAEADWSVYYFSRIEKYAVGVKLRDHLLYGANIYSGSGKYRVFASTSVLHKISFYATAACVSLYTDNGISWAITNVSNKSFDGYGVIAGTNGWQVIDETGWSNEALNYSKTIGDASIPTWCSEPISGDLEVFRFNGVDYPTYARTVGYQITAAKALINWQFNYCTNAFWE